MLFLTSSFRQKKLPMLIFILALSIVSMLWFCSDGITKKSAEALREKFASTKNIAEHYEIAKAAVEFGDEALPFLREILNTDKYKKLFVTDDVYWVFKRQLAIDMARIGSKEVAEVLKEFYYTGSRNQAIDRKYYEIRFGWQEPLAEMQDAKGRRWAIIALWWYGTSNDLWILYSEDSKKWTHPLFTGVKLPQNVERQEGGKPKIRATLKSNSIRMWYKSVDKTISKESIGIPIVNLTKDTDGDGFYDIEEKRFLTDYQNPDTDGDGLKDGGDLNPLAAPLEKMNDEAQIRQAIFKIHARQQTDIGAPVLVIAKEKEKQEYLGVYPQQVLCFTQGELDRFRKEAGYIGCNGVTIFFYGGMSGAERISDKPIDIQGDQAKLEFVEYNGPLAAQGYLIILKKLHGVWVVLEDKVIWVS